MRTALLGAAAVVLLAGTAVALPLTLTGNYLNVGISDFGTFGSNGSTSPGLRHDPTGTQTFGVNDYLTPGTPHDGFALTSTQYSWAGAGASSNNNNFGSTAFGSASPGLLFGLPALGYAFAAAWSGSGLGVGITNSYFFNPNDERILIRSVITATEALTDVKFGRSIDPDPDVNTFGSFNTRNVRGDILTTPENLVSSAGPFNTRNVRGDILTTPENLVSSAGPSTGLTLAILNSSSNPYTSNTGISSFCCQIDDPSSVLVGYGPTHPSFNIGDFGLQMAWNLGDFSIGQTRTVEYYYVFGANQDVISTPTPEPASLAILGFGLGALALARRRRRT